MSIFGWFGRGRFNRYDDHRRYDGGGCGGGDWGDDDWGWWD